MPAAADGNLKVVASGLGNPRGIAVAHGAIYVAEAGVGGDDVCQTHPELGETCIGRSGSVTRITGGHQERIARGLPSTAGPDGSFATGVHDVAVGDHGRDVRVVFGLGAGPSLRAAFGPIGRVFGTVQRYVRGDRRPLADIAVFEAAENSDGQADGPEPDSNPYSLVRVSGRGAVVADAGGNSLLRVRSGRRVSTIATFPNQEVDNPFGKGTFPMQSVPTSVVRGHDGAFYVGELTGFPFAVGKARVWRVVPGERPRVYARGFTNIIDLAVEPDGVAARAGTPREGPAASRRARG